jgi:hypothetical protein
MIRPRMPIRTVQYCRTMITASPMIRHAVTDQVPPEAYWKISPKACIPSTTQGNSETTPITLATTLTGRESNRRPSRSGCDRRL